MIAVSDAMKASNSGKSVKRSWKIDGQSIALAPACAVTESCLIAESVPNESTGRPGTCRLISSMIEALVLSLSFICPSLSSVSDFRALASTDALAV
jgi:hypothetical protein